MMTSAMKGPVTLIFDMDGTLLDSAPGIVRSLSHAIRRLGHDFQPKADIHALFGRPMGQVVAQLLRPFGDDRIAECVNLYRDHYGERGLYDCAPYPGISEALELLAGDGFLLTVATSKRQAFAEKMLRHAGLHARFADIRGTTADGTLDDKADLLGMLLKSLRHPASPAFMIGDKRDDMLAASKNGIPAIGVTWGYGTAQELSTSGALALVASPGELEGLLRRLVAECEQ